MEDLSGKKALVVGGSGGIGRALCELLHEEGVRLSIHGGHDTDRFTEFSEKLSAEKIVCNFTPENFLHLEDNSVPGASRLLEALSTADILCLSFGPFLQKPYDETDLPDWHKTALLDFALPGYLSSKAISAMKSRNYGRILFFGGTRTGQINGFCTNPAYGAAKTAVSSLCRSISENFSKNGITSNVVLPGFTDTEYVTPEAKVSYEGKSVSGKMFKTSEIAECGLFLIKNPQLNGVLLNADGGWKPF